MSALANDAHRLFDISYLISNMRNIFRLRKYRVVQKENTYLIIHTLYLIVLKSVIEIRFCQIIVKIIVEEAI